MAYTRPTVADFKAYFSRDFPYNADPNIGITDADITKAQGEANFNINEGLFSSQANFNIGFNYLTAHYLTVDIKASSQGIYGSFNWPEQSKSVGSVSQSFSIPQRILDNPMFSFYTTSPYGAKYLNLILPQLSGQIFTVAGRTLP